MSNIFHVLFVWNEFFFFFIPPPHTHTQTHVYTRIAHNCHSGSDDDDSIPRTETGQGPSRPDPYRRYVCLSFHPFFLESHLSSQKKADKKQMETTATTEPKKTKTKTKKQWDALEKKQTRVTTRQASKPEPSQSDASLFSVRSDIFPIFIFFKSQETFESRSNDRNKREGQVSFSFFF